MHAYIYVYKISTWLASKVNYNLGLEMKELLILPKCNSNQVGMFEVNMAVLINWNPDSCFHKDTFETK